ncbi:MAG: hypothetical protein K0S25_146 [Bacillus sp. (in: firmicutes)]|nr:hypothetical protein [Bacillus sp. (in: firmicutes)]
MGCAREDLNPNRQRSRTRQPYRVRHYLQATGNDRVGIGTAIAQSLWYQGFQDFLNFRVTVMSHPCHYELSEDRITLNRRTCANKDAQVLY